MARNFTMQWQPPDVTMPTANAAQFTNQNNRPVNAFDATTSESVILQGTLPAEYTGSGTLKLKVWAMANGTSSVTGILDISGEFITPDNAESGNSDSFNTSTDTGTITFADAAWSVESLEITLSDTKSDESPAAGDLFRIKVERDVADTLSSDLMLLAYELYEEV